MNKMKMETLRDMLNSMIISDTHDKIELLNRSQEMDRLILQSVRKDRFINEIWGEKALKEFDIMIDKLQLFEKMFETMRIVDPIGKKVLEIKENELVESDFICYEFWQRHNFCDNCISMRAYNEDNTIIKIEPKGGQLYIVTAIPVNINERKLIVEFIKNATDSIYFWNGRLGEQIKVISMLEYINQAAIKDDLTNLYNRRFINERLPVDLLNSTMKNEPLSIIFADLDFFKSVNDTYGHSVGDQVLQEFSQLLKNHIRNDKDWAARYGGEEFLICLPNTGNKAARAIAERIRMSITDKAFTSVINDISLTCSFGVHTVCPDDMCQTIDEIIELADQKLYKAKREGRNKVV